MMSSLEKREFGADLAWRISQRQPFGIKCWPLDETIDQLS